MCESLGFESWAVIFWGCTLLPDPTPRACNFSGGYTPQKLQLLFGMIPGPPKGPGGPGSGAPGLSGGVRGGREAPPEAYGEAYAGMSDCPHMSGHMVGG